MSFFKPPTTPQLPAQPQQADYASVAARYANASQTAQSQAGFGSTVKVGAGNQVAPAISYKSLIGQ